MTPDAAKSGPSYGDLLADESPDALVAVGLDGVILWWNQGATTMFGFTRAEAVGQALETLIVPDTRVGEARLAFDATLRAGESVFETVRRCRDGTTVPVAVVMRRIGQADESVAV